MSQIPSFALICHPSAACPAIAGITVHAAFTPAGELALAYSLAGDLGGLAIPAARPPGAADELWKHTCFEAFVGAAGSRAYREFNFSPSGQWAAYAFSAYRERDESLHPDPDVPRIAVRRQPDRLELDAVLAPAALPEMGRGSVLQVGMTAVIEAADGSLSYWSLSHPGMRPDFHHRGGFILNLPFPGNP